MKTLDRSETSLKGALFLAKCALNFSMIASEFRSDNLQISEITVVVVVDGITVTPIANRAKAIFAQELLGISVTIGDSSGCLSPWAARVP